jgi:hypothetical protein
MTNPYATPRSLQSARPTYRPNVVNSWICWIARGCDLQIGHAEPSRELLLHGHLFWTLAPLILATGGPLFFLAVAFIDEHPQPVWIAPYILAGLCLAIGGLGLLARERVVFTPTHIHKFGPFGRQRQLAWSTVTYVVFGNGGAVRLVSESGIQIRIPSDMVGIVDMVAFLDRYLPPDVLEECSIDLCKYRRFLGIV